VKRAGLQGVNLLIAATRAFNAVRPAEFLQIRLAGFIVGILRLDLMKRNIGLRAKDFCFHDVDIATIGSGVKPNIIAKKKASCINR